MGDVENSANDFGYITIRNYFETSHDKGPQDGAGANLKNKAEMAVIKQQVRIYRIILIYSSVITLLKMQEHRNLR